MREDVNVACLELDRMRILDLGCGTGSLCDAFAARGHAVTGSDPSMAMLAVAREKPHASAIEWVESTAQDFESGERFDLVTMTGHAFQALLGDADIAALLRTVRRHLAAGGTFVFESRNPAIDWAHEWHGHRSSHDSVFGRLDCSIRVVESAGRTISFEQAYAFRDATLISSSTLRFPSDAQIRSLLEFHGFEVASVLGDWDGTRFDRASSREMIFEARVRSR